MEDELSREEKEALIRQKGVRFMRNIKIHKKTGKKSGQDFFYIRPKINGKSIYIGFKSEAEAKELLSILPKRTNSTDVEKTFAELFFYALEDLNTDSTKSSYYRLIKHLKPIMTKPISTINERDIVDIFLASPKSTRPAMYGVLRRVCKASMDSEFIKIYESIKGRFKYKSNEKKVENPEEVIQKFVSFESDSMTDMRAKYCFLFLAATGLRIGEFLALDEDDIVGNKAKISKTTTSSFTYSNTSSSSKTCIKDSTKSGLDRTIIVTKDALFFWEKYQELNKKIRGKRTAPLARSCISNQLQSITKKMGLKGVTAHSARHIFATIFGRKCKSFDEAIKLQNLLGHSSMATTQRYIKETEVTEEDLMGIFGSVFEEKEKGKNKGKE
jgi:integrase